MREERKIALILIPLVWGGGLCSGVLCRWTIAPHENPEQHVWAIPIGLMVGFLVCWWLHQVWNPKTLTSNSESDKYASCCLFPVVFVGGYVLVNFMLSMLAYDISQILAASIFVAITIIFGYMWVQAFRYRSEDI